MRTIFFLDQILEMEPKKTKNGAKTKKNLAK